MTAGTWMIVAASAVGLTASAGWQPVQLGGMLRPGTRLLYMSNGEPQPPWTIDSITIPGYARPAAQCAVLHVRRQPDQTRADETRLCLARDTILAWDSTRRQWTPSRPAGAGMILSLPRQSGGAVVFETAGTSVDTISGLVIPVVLTTVTTRDSLGQPLRRLRERYAVGLATATRGTFEVPDSAAAGQWRAQREFMLHAIEHP